MPDTIASVFIVESLKFEDEENGRHEGQVLQQILHLSGKDARYFYIRTQKELEHVLQEFYDSKFRYLHLSCHGNAEQVCLTLDAITFKDFGELVSPFLENRRLFVSACAVVNEQFAAAVIPGSNCFSIVGPSSDVYMSEATMAWAAFYHLVFKSDKDSIKKSTINTVLRKTLDVFGVGFKFFGKATGRPGFKEHLLIDKKRNPHRIAVLGSKKKD